MTRKMERSIPKPVSDPVARLRRLTEQARAADRAEVDSAADPPRAGELYVFRETADFPVEWAVLGRAPTGGQLLVVPADTHPPVGAEDIEVTGTAAPLTLRCRHGVWTAAAAFDPELRTGRLEPEVVRQAWHRWQSLASGELTPMDEPEPDPARLEWQRDVLVPAVAVLTAGTPPQAAVPTPTDRGWSFGRFAAAAAAVLLIALSAALIAGLYRSGSSEPETLAEGPVPLLNQPLAWLIPRGAMRGSETSIEIPASAQYLLLILEAPGDFRRYRLDLVESDTGRVRWQTKELEIVGVAELSVALPVELLEAGAYRLRLYGLPQENTPLVEYPVRFVVGAGP